MPHNLSFMILHDKRIPPGGQVVERAQSRADWLAGSARNFAEKKKTRWTAGLADNSYIFTFTIFFSTDERPAPQFLPTGIVSIWE
jgi:hypothetical protein